MHQLLPRRYHFALWLLILVIFSPEIARSQSLSTISIGDGFARLEALGVPAVSQQKMGPHTAIRFELPDGNSLSATYRNSDGVIVFLESDWGGKHSGSFTDFRDFKFGVTSLSDIREVLGHNGMAFVNGPGMSVNETGDLIAVNSFELTNSTLVVTFITKVDSETLNRLRQRNNGQEAASFIGESAVLDAIILADMNYLSGIWDDKIVRDSQYRRITWE